MGAYPSARIVDGQVDLLDYAGPRINLIVAIGIFVTGRA